MPYRKRPGEVRHIAEQLLSDKDREALEIFGKNLCKTIEERGLDKEGAARKEISDYCLLTILDDLLAGEIVQEVGQLIQEIIQEAFQKMTAEEVENYRKAHGNRMSMMTGLTETGTDGPKVGVLTGGSR